MASHPEAFPSLPLAEWEESKVTLHLLTQVVGKVKLALNPPVNHWWHIPLYVSSRGLTTAAMPADGALLELEFDFREHVLRLRHSAGERSQIGLQGLSVASFYGATMEALDVWDIHPEIDPRPFDPERVKSDVPFADDDVQRPYDAESVQRFWRILTDIEPVFRRFRGRYIGKCSPVHFFWHSFDLAVTRFSGRKAALPEDVDPVTRGAYSHEVISHGFWAGDDKVPEPAFYSYTAPEPAGLGDEKLQPTAASWQEADGARMALYRYEDFRAAADPTGALLDFLQSSYDAGARCAAWPDQEDRDD